MAKKSEKIVRAKAKCASFDIEIVATIRTKGLVPDEVNQIKRKLKQKFTDAVAVLPFAHVYPCEVRVR